MLRINGLICDHLSAPTAMLTVWKFVHELCIFAARGQTKCSSVQCRRGYEIYFSLFFDSILVLFTMMYQTVLVTVRLSGLEVAGMLVTHCHLHSADVHCIYTDAQSLKSSIPCKMPCSHMCLLQADHSAALQFFNEHDRQAPIPSCSAWQFSAFYSLNNLTTLTLILQTCLGIPV